MKKKPEKNEIKGGTVSKFEPEGVLCMLFPWEEEGKDDDRNFQLYKLFLMETETKRYVQQLRSNKRISVTEINKKLNEFKDLMNKQFKTTGVSEKSELANKATRMWNSLQRHVKERISINDIRKMLKIFDLPWSYEYPLRCYVLTEKILNPVVKVGIYHTKDRVILEVSPDAADDDIKKAFHKVVLFQQRLPGYQMKGRRLRKKAAQHLEITGEYAEYKKMSKGIDKEDFKLAMVDNHNPGAIEKPKQRREEARHRKIFQRNKKYT